MEEQGNLVINGCHFVSYSLDKPTVYKYDNDDARKEEFEQIKQRCRISPDELWNLSDNFLKFIYPRLKRYRNAYCSCSTNKDTKHKLNIMLWAIKHRILDDIPWDDKKRQHKLQRGLNLLSKWMYSFWI